MPGGMSAAPQSPRFVAASDASSQAGCPNARTAATISNFSGAKVIFHGGIQRRRTPHPNRVAEAVYAPPDQQGPHRHDEGEVMAVVITRRRLVIGIIITVLAASLATAIGVRIVKRSQEGKDGKGPPVTLEFAPADLAVAERKPLSRDRPAKTRA